MEEFSHAGSGRIIKYTFAPSVEEYAPLLILFHGHTTSPRPSKFVDPRWNVLCPIDDFGVSGAGSWYLGEGGDFFWLDAIPELVSHVYGGNEIYCAGSSMGGYAAILHGTRMGAVAAYANVAQTLLLGSSYSEGGMKKFFAPIFGHKNDSEFNDLRKIVNKGASTSYIISGLRWDKTRYLEEQTFSFVSHLLENDINFSVEVQLGGGHRLTHSMPEIADILLKGREHFRIKTENVFPHQTCGADQAAGR